MIVGLFQSFFDVFVLCPKTDAILCLFYRESKKEIAARRQEAENIFCHLSS